MKAARPLVVGLLLVSITLLPGCPESTQRGGTPSECTRLGDRCQLPSGPIGICSETTEPCDAPPCIACMSQH